MENRRCRICGSIELEPITTLPNYPMVAGPVTKVPKTAPTCDLEVGLCHHCGTCVLLNEDIDSLVYNDDYTSSNIAYGQVKGMDEKTDRFVEFVGRARKPMHSKVLEIGCYEGTFMGLLEERYRFNMTGCEPCVAIAEEARRKGYDVVPRAFNPTDYSGLDMIVARNILEHIPAPRQFVRDIASTLKQDGSLVVEVPAGEHFISNGILGTIVPEHPCYFGERSLERLLEGYFAVVMVEEHGATIRALASFPQDSNDSKDTTVYATRLKGGGQMRQARYDAVWRTIRKERVDVFGANTCALELIATGAIRVARIGRVYDDDPRKWDRYLVNTNLAVFPRNVLKRRLFRPPRKVLVCSYTHRRSIADYITKQNNIAVMLYGDDE